MRIFVTGACGYKGTTLIPKLLDSGYNVVAFDIMWFGNYLKPHPNLEIIKGDIRKINQIDLIKIDKIIHLASVANDPCCEINPKLTWEINVLGTMQLIDKAFKSNVRQFIYASSASVYGLGEKGFLENPSFEMPLNAYAYSKFLFDQFVRKTISKNETRSQIVGLRYFNVYGPGENHKGRMSSVVNHLFQQAKEKKSISLFAGTGNIKDGEQKRDFIHVDDCIVLKLWLMEQNDVSGIFNCGTGVARSFNDIAKIIQEWSKKELNKNLNIKYIDFPNDLVGKYQNYTCADMNSVKEIGFNYKMKSLEEGVMSYLDYLNRTDKH